MLPHCRPNLPLQSQQHPTFRPLDLVTFLHLEGRARAHPVVVFCSSAFRLQIADLASDKLDAMIIGLLSLLVGSKLFSDLVNLSCALNELVFDLHNLALR